MSAAEDDAESGDDALSTVKLGAWTGGTARDGTMSLGTAAGQTVATVHVVVAGTFDIEVPVTREWIGPADHPEASKPAQVVAFVDGACAGAVDVTTPAKMKLRLALGAGDHVLSLALANDYWDPARGPLDRNAYAGVAHATRTSAKAPALPAADVCAAHHVYPAPPSPFDDDACPGDPIKFRDVVATIQPGSDWRYIGWMGVVERRRRCGPTGCAEWGPVVPTTARIVNQQLAANVELHLDQWGHGHPHVLTRWNQNCSAEELDTITSDLGRPAVFKASSFDATVTWSNHQCSVPKRGEMQITFKKSCVLFEAWQTLAVNGTLRDEVAYRQVIKQ